MFERLCFTARTHHLLNFVSIFFRFLARSYLVGRSATFCRAALGTAAAPAPAPEAGVIVTARDPVEAETGQEIWTATNRWAAEAAAAAAAAAVSAAAAGQGGTGTRCGIEIAGGTIAGGTGAQGGLMPAAADGTGTGTTAETADRPGRARCGPANPTAELAALASWCGRLPTAELAAQAVR
jgi:hypothetical protein